MRARIYFIAAIIMILLLVRFVANKPSEEAEVALRTETVKSETLIPESPKSESLPKPKPRIIESPNVAAKQSTVPPSAGSSGPPRQGQIPQVPPPPGYPVIPEGYYPPYRAAKAPFIRYEKKANRVVKEREIEDFSKEVRAKNIAPFVVAGLPYFPPDASKPSPSTPSSDPSQPVGFDKLVGSYDGEIRFDDGKRVWQMTLELSGKFIEGKLKGEATVDLLENGTSFSKTTQKGELNLLKKVAENSIGILLTPTDTHVFQLYYLQERDMLVGNYYEKKSPTQIVPVATVRLPRKPAPPRS